MKICELEFAQPCWASDSPHLQLWTAVKDRENFAKQASSSKSAAHMFHWTKGVTWQLKLMSSVIMADLPLPEPVTL
jgi:hypothetical protein